MKEEIEGNMDREPQTNTEENIDKVREEPKEEPKEELEEEPQQEPAQPIVEIDFSDSNNVTIITKEGRTVKIPTEIAKMSEAIKFQLQDVDFEKEIKDIVHLQECSENSLLNVIKFY